MILVEGAGGSFDSLRLLRTPFDSLRSLRTPFDSLRSLRTGPFDSLRSLRTPFDSLRSLRTGGVKLGGLGCDFCGNRAFSCIFMH
jgi:hypothetical protein